MDRRPVDRRAITVRTTVAAPVDVVWESFTEPQHITGWAFASDDWEASAAENDLREGGRFKTRMAARDGSAGFDFTGTYTVVRENELVEYEMDDGRHVRVEFERTPAGVQLTTTFDAEDENPDEVQRSGWQAILDNFRKYVEARRVG